MYWQCAKAVGSLSRGHRKSTHLDCKEIFFNELAEDFPILMIFHSIFASTRLARPVVFRTFVWLCLSYLSALRLYNTSCAILLVLPALLMKRFFKLDDTLVSFTSPYWDRSWITSKSFSCEFLLRFLTSSSSFCVWQMMHNWKLTISSYGNSSMSHTKLHALQVNMVDEFSIFIVMTADHK